MGGGDLNMKKSWHPLLMKNQERVWLEEKKALEERKKLEQLRKEKEEERQLQELQRLQEEQTGRKRSEKLEWMYATPASGSGTNSNDLEDYLLGKKRVDKILVGDENQVLGASHKNFIAVQHANTVRDTAAKVREDPLFAIKQQEQAALQALRENPLRLRELQERNGLVSKSEKKEKGSRKRKHRSRSPRRRDKRSKRSYTRSLSPYSDERRGRGSFSTRPTKSYRRDSESPDEFREGSSSSFGRGRDQARRYSHNSHHEHRSHSPTSRKALSRTDDNHRRSPRMREPRTGSNDSDNSFPKLETRNEDHSFNDSNRSVERSRVERLAAMISNASDANEERQHRLASRLAQEKIELQLEEQLRSKSRGSSTFLSSQQKRVFGGMDGGLGEYMRRGKAGLVMERD